MSFSDLGRQRHGLRSRNVILRLSLAREKPLRTLTLVFFGKEAIDMQWPMLEIVTKNRRRELLVARALYISLSAAGAVSELPSAYTPSIAHPHHRSYSVWTFCDVFLISSALYLLPNSNGTKCKSRVSNFPLMTGLYAFPRRATRCRRGFLSGGSDLRNNLTV